MLTLLSVFANLLIALIVFIVSRLKMNTGKIWSIAFTLTLANWGFILALKWLIPVEIVLSEWFPIGEIFQRNLLFQINPANWPILFSLAAIQFAVIATDSARLNEIPTPMVWAGLIFAFSAGFLASIASSIISIILIWVFVDLIELIIFIGAGLDEGNINEIIVSFAIKILGTNLLIFALITSYHQGTPLRIDEVVNRIGYLLLASVGLRLGVIPFNLPFLSSSPIRRGLGNSIRMVNVATSIVLLLRYPIGELDVGVKSVLLFFTVIGVVFGAVMWFSSNNELEGRPYFIISMTGLAIYAAINGNNNAILAWTLAMILSDSVLFLYFSRGKKLSIIPMVAIIGLSGLPFTPSATGWVGVINGDHILVNILIVISFAMILLGYVKHIYTPAQLLSQKEKWVWITFPFGLITLIVTHWLIFFLSEELLIEIGRPLSSISSFVLAVIFIFLIRKFFVHSEYSEIVQRITKPIGIFIVEFMSLKWVYTFLGSILTILQKITFGISNILEGQAGFLWVIIFLVMLISVFASGKYF